MEKITFNENIQSILNKDEKKMKAIYGVCVDICDMLDVYEGKQLDGNTLNKICREINEIGLASILYTPK